MNREGPAGGGEQSGLKGARTVALGWSVSGHLVGQRDGGGAGGRAGNWHQLDGKRSRRRAEPEKSSSRGLAGWARHAVFTNSLLPPRLHRRGLPVPAPL